MAEVAEGTRRERLRRQTLAEIREHALAQVAEGGPEALSLNAIARAMQMSGPALYRYFASREELLVALVADSYDDLARTVDAAYDGATPGEAGGRLRAVASAYRDWALTHPHRYRLVMASRYGSGLVAPDDVLPAATRTMNVLSAAVAELGGPAQAAADPSSRPLDEQLSQWQRDRAGTPTVPPAALHLSVVAWTRLHGVVSLEIEGVFASMGVDPDLLFAGEVDQLVTAALG